MTTTWNMETPSSMAHIKESSGNVTDVMAPDFTMARLAVNAVELESFVGQPSTIDVKLRRKTMNMLIMVAGYNRFEGHGLRAYDTAGDDEGVTR